MKPSGVISKNEVHQQPTDSDTDQVKIVYTRSPGKAKS